VTADCLHIEGQQQVDRIVDGVEGLAGDAQREEVVPTANAE